MAKLPPWPQEWNEQPIGIPGPGILAGWQEPGWTVENSALGLILPPETVTRINFGDSQELPAAQADALEERLPTSNLHDTLAALGAKPDHDFPPTDQGARVQLAAGNGDGYRPSQRRAEEYRGPTYNPRGIGPDASNPNRPRDFGTSSSVPDAKAGLLGALQSFVEPFVDARKLKNQEDIHRRFEGHGGASRMKARNFVGEDLGKFYNRPGYKDANGGFWVDRNYDGSMDEYIFFKNGAEYRNYGTGIQRWKSNMRPPFPPPPVNKRYDGS